MFSIFSSEQATTAVNIIVIVAFLSAVIYLIVWITKKLKPEVIESSFTQKLETSTTSQNIFAFTTVVLASTLFELFNDSHYRMIWIVLIISVMTILFDYIYNKVSHTNNAIEEQLEYKANFTLIEKIMHCKGYDLILNASEIEEVENRSEEIYIFTENLTTDIPKKDLSSKTVDRDNMGLFADLVASNIPRGKKYTYFLKDTAANLEYIEDYYAYHFSSKETLKYRSNVEFYLVTPSDFTFFSELYFYKDDQLHDMAFEWLPALGEIGDSEKQFYLELSSAQVQNINEIIIELKSSYRLYNVSNKGSAS